MREPLTQGDVLSGKYRIEGVLGRGGMAVVVAAMHTELHQRVAIKALREGASDEVVARFRREARAAVRLKSEHVARVLDVGEMPSGDPYMVMEHLDGVDLAKLVRAEGARPVDEAVDHVLEACEAIAEAHGMGIIHRDLKPANLFLTRAADGSQTIKVLDFGISKTPAGAAEDADGGVALTQSSAMLGSPQYMAPEQMRSAREADERSDVWSLGAILYELVTGVAPFNGDSYATLVLLVNNMPPPTPTARGAKVPPALEAAVLRCLEKDPAQRFADVAELAAAIVPFGTSRARTSAARIARTLEASGTAVSAGPAESIQPPSEGRSGTGPPWAKTDARAASPRLSIGLAVLVVALGVALLVVLLRPRGAPAYAPAAAPPPSATEPPAAPSAEPVVTPPPAPPIAAPSEEAASSAKPHAPAEPRPRTAATAKPTASATAPPAKRSPLDIQLQ